MKKLLYAMIALSLLAGCKKAEKDVYNYYPKVKTVSAVVQPDGTVKLMGELVSGGSDELQGVGFCMDTLPHPKMHYNQKICDTLFDNNFQTSYAFLDATKKYYFRAWAVNENGYTYGDDILVTDIKLTPASLPCAPDSNTVDVENSGVASVNYISPVDVSSAGWTFEVYAGNYHLYFTFFMQPVTGKWKIVEGTGSNSRYVNILYSGPFTSGTYAQGGNVYVNQISPGVFDVTVCDATLSIFSGDRKLTARFRVKG